MIETMYAMVKEFHTAKGHPVGGSVSGMTATRRLQRAGWILEEVFELGMAQEVTAQYDALIDAVYFGIGTCVELHFIPKVSLSDTIPKPRPGALTDDRKKDNRFIRAMQRSVLAFMVSRTTWRQCLNMTYFLQYAIRGCQRELGLDIFPGFNIVHQANMTKPANGSGNTAKIGKGDGWQGPEAALWEEIQRQYERAVLYGSEH